MKQDREIVEGKLPGRLWKIVCLEAFFIAVFCLVLLTIYVGISKILSLTVIRRKNRCIH